MNWLADLAYRSLGALPLIAVIGLVTYGLFAVTAVLVAMRPLRRRLGRRGLQIHRAIAAAAFALATFHLLLGLSSYV